MIHEGGNGLLTLHHVACVTDDLHGAINVYREMGYAASPVIHDPADDVELVLLKREGCATVELVCPISSKSPAFSHLAKRGPGPYHTCYEVSDLETAIRRLKQLQFAKVTVPRPAPAFGGKRVVFMFHGSIGLVELLENSSED
jgi:methylmalonyl-CoA/ethylmalonyl-CoA epimerase